ncbi:MAG: hypothetical protein AAFY59_17530, partial [Pseudomonadota bacterium]
RRHPTPAQSAAPRKPLVTFRPAPPIFPNMKHMLAAAFIALSATQAPAQEEDPSPFFEKWAEETMKGLLEEIQPELESMMEELGPQLDGLFAEMVPRLQELTEKLGGLVMYEMPEVLPNGDIIIRRKKSAPPVEIDPETNAPIEL